MAAAAGHIRKYMRFFSACGVPCSCCDCEKARQRQRAVQFVPAFEEDRERERAVRRTGGGETVQVDLYVDVATDTTHGHGCVHSCYPYEKRKKEI